MYVESYSLCTRLWWLSLDVARASTHCVYCIYIMYVCHQSATPNKMTPTYFLFPQSEEDTRQPRISRRLGLSFPPFTQETFTHTSSLHLFVGIRRILSLSEISDGSVIKGRRGQCDMLAREG